MVSLLKYFAQESLPTSKETGLGDVVSKEVNTAIEKVLQQELNRAEGVKQSRRQKEKVHPLHLGAKRL